MSRTEQPKQPSQSLKTFKKSLSGEVVCPGEEGYDYGIFRWTDNSVRPASYVVFPKSAEDVSKAIRFGKDEGLELAICGGGHSWSVSLSSYVCLIARGLLQSRVW